MGRVGLLLLLDRSKLGVANAVVTAFLLLPDDLLLGRLNLAHAVLDPFLRGSDARGPDHAIAALIPCGVL